MTDLKVGDIVAHTARSLTTGNCGEVLKVTLGSLEPYEKPTDACEVLWVDEHYPIQHPARFLRKVTKAELEAYTLMKLAT